MSNLHQQFSNQTIERGGEGGGGLNQARFAKRNSDV